MDNIIMGAGVDPGSKNLGYAFYGRRDDGSEVYEAFSNPSIQFRVEQFKKYNPALTVLEKVSAMPSDGVVSACKFIKSVGVWVGIFQALGFPYIEVPPAKWAKACGVSLPSVLGMPRPKRRKILKDFKLEAARRRFPEADLKLKKDIDKAEALLMALCAYNFYTQGKL